MKEMKILAVLLVLVGAMYFGIEPYAHSKMHKHVEEADFKYSDLAVISGEGNVEAGAGVAASCTSCHSIEVAGFKLPSTASELASIYGVVPPDLSNAGLVYESNFLKNFVMNPDHAAYNSTYKKAKSEKLLHEEEHASKEELVTLKSNFDKDIAAYSAKTKLTMPAMVFDEQSANDLVAYLKSIAVEKLSNEEMFAAACSRCHTAAYTQQTCSTPADSIDAHFSNNPPDLSQMIKSRGHEYLVNFISDPQKYLTGTQMPRVGLTQDAAIQVVDYLETVGDPKKEERETLGIYVLLFSFVLAIFGYLWKREVFAQIH